MSSKKLAARIAATAALVCAATGLTIAPSDAATAPVSNAHVLVPWSLAKGEQPENITAAPDGDLLITLSRADEVVEVTPAGRQRVVVKLPAPADGGVHTPVLGFAFLGGIVRTPDGTLYLAYSTGNADTTGIWRVRPGRAPERVVALGAGSFANGMALDPRTGQIYFADSTAGVVWRFSDRGRVRAAVWASDAKLRPTGVFGLGANGVKVHSGAVWVSNSDQKSLMRIPIRRDGTAGAVETTFTGSALDDFTFIKDSDVVVGAFDPDNEVAIIRPDGSYRVVLDASDGLQGPTSVQISHGKLYVNSAAFVTQKDPNLLVADIDIRAAIHG